MSSAAEKLNKLTIATLKPILAKVGLPVSGKKNELVDRILASPAALAAAGLSDDVAPAPAEEMSTDLPDLPIAEEPSTSTAAAPVPAAVEAPAPVASEEPAPAAAVEAPAKLDDEAERRRKRAERFGIPVVEEKKKPEAKAAKPSTKAPPKAEKPAPAPLTDEEADRRRKRAERFGLPVAAPGAASNGRTKGAAKEPAAPATVDSAEEERKRKRAERFGNVAGAPADKKAKADS